MLLVQYRYNAWKYSYRMMILFARSYKNYFNMKCNYMYLLSDSLNLHIFSMKKYPKAHNFLIKEFSSDPNKSCHGSSPVCRSSQLHQNVVDDCGCESHKYLFILVFQGRGAIYQGRFTTWRLNFRLYYALSIYWRNKIRNHPLFTDLLWHGK